MLVFQWFITKYISVKGHNSYSIGSLLAAIVIQLCSRIYFFLPTTALVLNNRKFVVNILLSCHNSHANAIDLKLRSFDPEANRQTNTSLRISCFFDIFQANWFFLMFVVESHSERLISVLLFTILELSRNTNCLYCCILPYSNLFCGIDSTKRHI